MPLLPAKQHANQLDSLCTDLSTARHVIVASNRGPLSFRKRGNGSLDARLGPFPASGAVSALTGRLPLTWVAAGVGEGDRLASESAADGRITQGMPEGWTMRLVFPPRRAYHRFYNIVCNPLLWFLHHRSWGFTHTPNIDQEAQDAWDGGFRVVSEEIARTVAVEASRAAQPAAVIVQDYHLQLVPGLVRDALPDAFLQYTVDVPWPGPEVWLMLPADWRDSIFKGILACDVVGFRSLRDRASFCHCVEGLVPGATVGPLQNSVEFRGRSTRLSVYRPTVDLDAVKARAESDDVLKETDPAGFDGSLHTFLTAERAEPFKNIVRSIRAYGYLLERRPELHTASRFLLLLAPAPPHLAQYRRYAEEIKRAANEVNGRHGGRGWQPVQLHFENNYAKVLAALSMFNTLVSVPIAESQCTTALTGPLINRREGTLILSESAGAAELIGQHAQLVSPTDVRGLAEAMERAFDMEVGDRKRMAECIAAAIGALTTEDVAARQLGDLLEVAKLKGGS